MSAVKQTRLKSGSPHPVESLEKVNLPRLGADTFWTMVSQHYDDSDELKWRALAMLALRENAGWTIERIAKVYGHHKGHVSRVLENIKAEIRLNFKAEPSYEIEGDDN